jgi:hypothetical protein
MIVRMVLFNALLLGAFAYALWHGRSDERITAAACVVASAASFLLMAPQGLRYSTVEIGILAVDLLTLATFTLVALRSDRFWPLWVSGLQLVTSVAHIMKAAQPDLMPIAYAAAGRFWAYPILLIIIVGTWRGHQRGLREQRALAA